MIEFPLSLFQRIQEALWLLDQSDQVWAVTQLAKQIETNYRFSLKAILEISRGEGCALHSTKEECLNCSLP